MFLVELIASSFLYLISKQSRLDAAVSALLFKLYCVYSISFKSSNVCQFRGVEPYITCTIAYQTHRSQLQNCIEEPLRAQEKLSMVNCL